MDDSQHAMLIDPSAPRDADRRSVVVGLVTTARVKQWSKNLLVFAAPGAAGVLTHPDALLRSSVAFVAFCAVSAGTYFINDAVDAEADRRHPTKQNRPVAAGTVSRPLAVAVGAASMAAGIATGTALAWPLGLVLAIYVALQPAYSLYLKHQPVLDLVTVAAGFVLRAIAGAVAVPVPVSEWFLIVATFASLLMVTGKRVAEHTELGDRRGTDRPTLDAYTPTFLRTVLAISAGGAIMDTACGPSASKPPSPTITTHLVSALHHPHDDRPPALHLPRRKGARSKTRTAPLRRPPPPNPRRRLGLPVRPRHLHQLSRPLPVPSPPTGPGHARPLRPGRRVAPPRRPRRPLC